MNFSNLKTAGIALLTLTSLTGCVDDKYDLSDIDTTAGVKVNDLVVPVNIDAVTLNSVLDLKEGDNVQVVDGQYIVLETGDFHSDPISIKAINMAAPTIKSTVHNCVAVPGSHDFNISSNSSPFTYNSNDVSDCIVSIDGIGTHWTLTIQLAIEEINGSGNATVRDLVLRLPKGMTLVRDADKYDPATGLFRAGTRPFNGAFCTIEVEASAVNAAQAGIDYDYRSHTATMHGNCAVESGVLNIDAGSFDLLHIHANYTMSRITATSFTGEVKYDIDGTSFSDVDLGNLPKFLSQSGTDIRLTNPQIYLCLDDPLNVYSLTARTGLTISSWGGDTKRGDYSLDTPGFFDIATSPAARSYDFCLSPAKPEKYYTGTDVQWVGYKALSNVLSGDGIPSRLAIRLDDPRLPVQRVKDLKLGESLGAVTGTYTFFAPLSLADGSVIAYTGTQDDWSSEDLDAVTISALTVTAVADSDLPVEAELVAYPIDKYGNRIGDCEITGTTLKPMCKGEPITMTMKGTVRYLDGVRYVVKVNQADAKVLTPEMSVKLSQVRARVSGEYVKKL